MKNKSGFTVIEVMLFLTITASLAIALLVGTGLAIQRQQYNDAVRSFSGFMSTQYSRVISVENERSSDETCPLLTGEVLKTGRGQSDCVIIGRYIQTKGGPGGNDGREYETYPVFALQALDKWSYALGSMDGSYMVGGGAETRLSGQNSGDESVSVLMYRHPESGSIAIKAGPDRHTSESIGGLIEDISGGSSGTQEICVYGSGWLSSGGQSISIGKQAGSSDAVTMGIASEGCGE